MYIRIDSAMARFSFHMDIVNIEFSLKLLIEVCTMILYVEP